MSQLIPQLQLLEGAVQGVQGAVQPPVVQLQLHHGHIEGLPRHDDLVLGVAQLPDYGGIVLLDHPILQVVEDLPEGAVAVG